MTEMTALTSMNEMRQILDRANELRRRGEPAVLATVVAVEGSAYRREGARMLIEADGALTGILSGGCFERDLAARAADVLASGEAALATYDLRSPDEVLWGLGLGCGGKITLLLEPLPSAVDGPSPLDPFEQVSRDRIPVSVRTKLGKGALLCEEVVPAVRLVLAGAGRDALPLAKLGAGLGWETVVLDARATAAAEVRFSGLARYLAGSPGEFEASLHVDPFTAVVVMTHNYLDDLAWLAALLPTAAPYVGLLGPAARRDRLLADLALQGLMLTAEMRARLHGPAGLDLGGRSAEQVALAIVAEVQAMLTGCRRSAALACAGIRAQFNPRRPRALSVAGVLLAAGTSSRLGRSKALLPYRGSTLLRHAAETLCATPCSPCLVIVGPEVEKSCRQVKDLEVEVVENPDHRQGLSTSLRAALRAIEARESATGDEVQGLLITLVDQPLVTAAHLNAVLAAGRETGLCASAWASTFGPPAFLYRSFFASLKELCGDEGAKPILTMHRDRLRLVAFPGGAVDIDDEADYGRLLSGAKA